MSQAAKFSEVEGVKLRSHYLRGTIQEELAAGGDQFCKPSTGLLKFHGTYQQDDRDLRQGKDDRYYIFMVRSKIPGGRLTAEQLLAELDLCEEVGNTTLRITSRQGLQLHGVVKQNLHRAIRRINEIQLSTLGACGDVNRNVMCCPAPYTTPLYAEIQALSSRLAQHFAPRATSYHEIWLTDPESGVKEALHEGNGEVDLPFSTESDDVEPIYGKLYLPRKFKMAICLPEDNCIDVYANDLGMIAVVRDGRIVGYNLAVGGSMGVTPSAKKTFPAIARRMAFAPAEEIVAIAEAIVKVQRDFGNREDRKRARLKYLIHDWGVAKFKAKVEEYYGKRLEDPTPDDVTGFNDHMGWDEQGDGRWFYGLNVENGRIRDDETMQLKTAIREICHTLHPGIRLTGHQSILFSNIEENRKSELEEILRKHNVKLTEEISTVRRWSMACVAWPTCGLAVTESERALPPMIDQLEVELAKLGLSNEKFTVRMTGCPNGCARPYNSDVGLVGKTVGKYTVFLGGRLLGNRMNWLYKDLVPAEEVVATLVPPLVYFKQSRQEGESFGDFCERMGKDALLAFAEKFAAGEGTRENASDVETAAPTATPAEEAAGEDRRRIVELLARLSSPTELDQLAFLLGLPLDRSYEARELLQWADNCCGGIEQLLTELKHVVESRPAEPAASRLAESNGSLTGGAAAGYPAATTRRSLESMNGEQSTTSVISENLYLKLTLDRDPSLYTPEEQEHFLAALGNLLHITPVVIERQPGAVKLNLKLTPEETQRLLAAAKKIEH
jgi:sulfite reductase (ferredoxin)